MQSFMSDGVRIAFRDDGAGDPILLIHGFASNVEVNWARPGWIDALTGAGRRVIAIDNRGHGHSEKLYAEEDYGAPLMAEDSRRLLDHLEIERADVMGYSMGARIAAFLAHGHPDRVRRIVFGGLGANMVRGLGGAGAIARALEAPSIDDVTNDTARTFRDFAEKAGGDLKALAACIRSARAKITPEMLAGMDAPVLVAVGSRDVIGGSAEGLARLLPNGEAFTIEDRDHNRAVGDRRFKERVTAFLARP
jgi:pimeloyl-ACP methyl ester carboxylesterase